MGMGLRRVLAGVLLVSMVCAAAAMHREDEEAFLSKESPKRTGRVGRLLGRLGGRRHNKVTPISMYDGSDEAGSDGIYTTAHAVESEVGGEPFEKKTLTQETCDMERITIKATTWNLGEGPEIPSVGQFKALLESTSPARKKFPNNYSSSMGNFADIRDGAVHSLRGGEFRVRPQIIAFGLQEFRTTKKEIADHLRRLRVVALKAIINLYGDYYDDALDGGVETRDYITGLHVPTERIEDRAERRIEKSIALSAAGQGTQALLVFTHKACRGSITFKQMMKRAESSGVVAGFTGKGGIGAIFDLAYPSRQDPSIVLHKPLTFISTHLPSGDTHVAKRNAALNELLNDFESQIKLEYGDEAAAGIEFLMGDMNYRLQGIEWSEAVEKIREGPLGIRELLMHDEYRLADPAENPLKVRKFSEFPISFPPSYKHLPISEENMNDYSNGIITEFPIPEKHEEGVSIVNRDEGRQLVYITKNTKTSMVNAVKKQLKITGDFHTPSYTDRVFVKAGDNSQWFCGKYAACEDPMCASSDHIPVSITAAFVLNNVVAGVTKTMHYFGKNGKLVGQEMNSASGARLGLYDDRRPSPSGDDIADMSRLFTKLRKGGILPPKRDDNVEYKLQRSYGFRNPKSGADEDDGEMRPALEREAARIGAQHFAGVLAEDHYDLEAEAMRPRPLVSIPESDDEEVEESGSVVEAKYSSNGARDRTLGGASMKMAEAGMEAIRAGVKSQKSDPWTEEDRMVSQHD